MAGDFIWVGYPTERGKLLFPKAFFVHGDGVNDDTANIAAAIQRRQKLGPLAVIRFPEPEYWRATKASVISTRQRQHPRSQYEPN